MAALALTLLVGGCAGQQAQDTMREGFGHIFKVRHSIERFEAQCEATPFQARGACTRTKMTAGYPSWRSDSNADLWDVYLAWMEAAGARVSDGRMEEADAKLGAAEMKLRLKSISEQRATSAAIRDQIATTQLLTGLALMQSAQPQPAVIAPTAITCTTYATNAISGHTQTVCQ